MTKKSLSMKQKQNQGHSRLVAAKAERARGGVEREAGVSREKLQYTGRTDKVLLYRAGDYTQYPTTNYNGKEYTENECVRRTESLCYTAVINTTL